MNSTLFSDTKSNISWNKIIFTRENFVIYFKIFGISAGTRQTTTANLQGRWLHMFRLYVQKMPHCLTPKSVVFPSFDIHTQLISTSRFTTICFRRKMHIWQMYAYYHHELCIIIAQTVSGGEKSKGKGIGIGNRNHEGMLQASAVIWYGFAKQCV